MLKKAGKKIRMSRVNATKTMAENVFKSFFSRGFSKIIWFLFFSKKAKLMTAKDSFIVKWS